MNVADRPKLTTTQLRALLETEYGLTGSLTPLPGERDQNLLVNTGTDRFVLKIQHPEESPHDLDLQRFVLDALAQGPTPHLFPTLIRTASGAACFTVTGPDHQHLVRLVQYLPGSPIATLSEKPPALFQEVGHRLGEMDRALKPLAHPAMHRHLDWDSKHALITLDHLIHEIKDPPRQAMVQKALDRASHTHLPSTPRLPQQLIHNDVNDYNLLVNDAGRVSGIIDFGDVVFTYRVCELANAAAYLLMGANDLHATLRDLITGYQRAITLTDDERIVLPDLIRLRLCISVTMSTRQQRQDPSNEYLTISQKPAWELLEWMVDAKDTELTDEHRSSTPPRDSAQILSLRGQHLSATLSTSYQQPLKIVRGEGAFLIDDRGHRFLDCVNNVCHVGHCHPRVVEAATSQIELLNTNTRYLHDNIAEYARRLTGLFPNSLSVCFFVNSGSEANDLALRLARTHTKAQDLIVLDHAYHGHTQSLIDVSPYKFNGRGGHGAPHTTHVATLPDLYRGEFGYDDLEAGRKYARSVIEQIEMVARMDRPLAGFLAESFPGVAGQVELPPGYLEEVYPAVRAAGGVCLADEVQIGFGRVGDAMWAFENQGVVPDIVTLGKPIGNGHPLAAVITTPEIARSFENGMEYFNTFGGNPVSCAAGLAVLDVIESEGLVAHAHRVGKVFLNRLRTLACSYPCIGDVRGRGLFIGIELVRDRATKSPAPELASHVIEGMKQRGVLLSIDGPNHCVLKIKPPMVFDESNVEQFVTAFDEVLSTAPPQRS